MLGLEPVPHLPHRLENFVSPIPSSNRAVAHRIPSYAGLEMASAILWFFAVVIAIAGCWFSIHFMIHPALSFIMCCGYVGAGIILIALGSAAKALRDIARNSFRKVTCEVQPAWPEVEV